MGVALMQIRRANILYIGVSYDCHYISHRALYKWNGLSAVRKMKNSGRSGELEVATDSKKQLERVGKGYDREQMLAVRKMTLDAMGRIAHAVKPGMLEEDAVAQGRKILKEMGLLRGWHGVRVRFGPNTLKVFRARSEPGTILQENDIFFVDIGPVWQKWEGDAGNTYVVGTDTDMHRCKHDVRALHSGSLSAVNFAPTTDLWVLEIQIRHPERPIGAFYEDSLLDQGL